ncbi:hypothetical protein BH09BAC6_BH09BAC6_11170 [soil metagenome]|jgi:hypothetical protein
MQQPQVSNTSGPGREKPFAFSLSPLTLLVRAFGVSLSAAGSKPFTFRLSPFTLIKAFGLIMAMGFASCHRNPNRQTPGESYLQGEWQQDTIAYQKKLVSYSLYHFKFSCDSFYVAIRSFSKVNTGPDTCMNSGHWAEYTKGTYEQRNDTLHLKGQFCNADMSLKDDKGCFRSGDYEEFFKVIKKTDTQLQFSSTSSVIPIHTHLIKKTSCQPKAL